MSGERTTDEVPTPERNLAEVLCSLDGSWSHHDRTDDYPCSACLVVARTHLAAARADERERCVATLDHFIHLMTYHRAAFAQPAETTGADQ